MKNLKTFLIAVMTILVMASCGTTERVPITGRTHRIGVSDQQILSLSNQEYKKYMSSAKKSTNAANTAMVQRVGRRLANAVEKYLNNNGYANEVRNFAWEFNLVQDKSANAFCMPGGKIVVYEGLLPYTQDETSLAIVLGHEIAHAVAKHSAEQMTKQQNQSIGTNIGANVLGAITGSSSVGQIAGQIAGQYFSFRNLKYSRENELEADHMGLIFAAMAGYNPDVAVSFWKRMSNGNGNTNDFLSTHPSDAKRIAAIQRELPEAERYYQASKGQYTTPRKLTARKSTTTKRTTTRRK